MLMSFVRVFGAVFCRCTVSPETCGSRELAAVARPRRAGHSRRNGAADRVGGPTRTSCGKPSCPAPAFVAHRLGRPHLPDVGDRGRGVPGQRAVKHRHGRTGLDPSRQRRRRPEAHVQGARPRREDGKNRCGSTRLRGAGLRRAPPPQQLRRADAGDRRHMVFAYFGPEGLYAYDSAGKLLWKAVEKFPTLGLGTGTSPVLYGTS